MLTRAWFKLRYHKPQCELWRTSARFVAVAAGRGSGKTELARRRVVRYLPVRKPWPDPLYFYALPTIGQAKRVAWKPIKRLIPPHWIAKINESEMTIETIFGSTLYVIGLDKPHRAEGVQWDGGVLDESSDQKPGVFDLTFVPAFSHRDAWCWRIGVPKRTGIGAAEFKKACEQYANPNDPTTASFTWPSEDILTEDQIRWAMEKMDPRDYNEQYRAAWETAGGGIFHAFDTVENVSENAEYDPTRTVCVMSDFNVDPMCWCLGHRFEDGLAVFDEIFLRNTNTNETLDYLYKRLGTHEGGWEFYGDATGQSRRSSASESDYVQIKNDNRFYPKWVYYPRGNPRIANRFASTNALLKNAKGERRLMIHPRCTHLIADLETRAYKKGSREPDDYGDIGHMTDALGYCVYRRFRVRLDKSSHIAEAHVTSG